LDAQVLARQSQPAARTRPVPSRLVLNAEYADTTTRQLVGALEWSSLVYGAAVITYSAVLDHYSPTGRLILMLVAAGHLILSPVYARARGPFQRGGRWLLIPIAQCVVVNGLAAALSTPGTFARSPQGLPAGNYANALWALLAFYPWLPPRFSRYKTTIEWAGLSIQTGYLLILCWLTLGDVDRLAIVSTAMSMLWIVVGWTLGKGGNMVCLGAAKAQVDIQQQSFDEFFDFLHSHVGANIAAVRAALPVDARKARQQLSELEATVSWHRIELLLARERIPVAALLSERLRASVGVLSIERTPRVGALTVPRLTGVLVSHALGDLLKNAAGHGARSAAVDFHLVDGVIVLTITDDGPGFQPAVLDDPSRSLHRLRRSARDLGGDLRLVARESAGSQMELTLPLKRAYR
jgi:hypothetical protein